jgi:hypothetical protein
MGAAIRSIGIAEKQAFSKMLHARGSDIGGIDPLPRSQSRVCRDYFSPAIGISAKA